jgi:hypothetical protein
MNSIASAGHNTCLDVTCRDTTVRNAKCRMRTTSGLCQLCSDLISRALPSQLLVLAESTYPSLLRKPLNDKHLSLFVDRCLNLEYRIKINRLKF